MTRGNVIRTILLGGTLLFAGWQFRRHDQQAREYARLQEQIQSGNQQLANSKTALDDLEQQNSALLQHRRAGTNSMLQSLVRQRAAVTATTSAVRETERAESNRAFRHTLASTLDNPQQKEINRGLLRNELRARLTPLARKLNLAPEQMDQLVELVTEHELKKTDRLAALLRGEMPVADALLQRDDEHRQLQSELRSRLGDEGYALLDEGRQKGVTAQVDRDLNWINHDLGFGALNPDQDARLRNILHTEISAIIVDDTDTFRPPQDWERIYNAAVERVAGQAATFLAPDQLASFRKLAAMDLVESQEKLAAKRKGYGL